MLLDLDGTLVDSRHDLATATNLLMRDLELEPIPLKTVVSFVGRGARTLVRRALDHADPAQRVSRTDPRLRRFLAHYESVLLDTTAPFPGVRAGLAQLKARGVPMAVVTNKPISPALRVIDGLGLTEYFGGILGGDSLPTRKPAPEMLIEAARMLHVPLQSCLMVGDSDVDMEAAESAGIRGVWCSWGGFHPEQPRGECERVDVFDELVLLARSS